MQSFYFIHVGTEIEKKMANCSRLLETNAWFKFTCYHPPPGLPQGHVQVQPFEPGGGELFEVVLSRG